jgi:hypothetical protein
MKKKKIVIINSIKNKNIKIKFNHFLQPNFRLFSKSKSYKDSKIKNKLLFILINNIINKKIYLFLLYFYFFNKNIIKINKFFYLFLFVKKINNNILLNNINLYSINNILFNKNLHYFYNKYQQNNKLLLNINDDNINKLNFFYNYYEKINKILFL